MEGGSRLVGAKNRESFFTEFHPSTHTLTALALPGPREVQQLDTMTTVHSIEYSSMKVSGTNCLGMLRAYYWCMASCTREAVGSKQPLENKKPQIRPDPTRQREAQVCGV